MNFAGHFVSCGMCIFGLMACLAEGPVAAQEASPRPSMSDTVKAVTDNGIEMKVPSGLTFDFSYNPDGSLGGNLGIVGGMWAADGAKLCIEVPDYAERQCLTYPDGKKAGDRFTIDTPNGPISVFIRK